MHRHTAVSVFLAVNTLLLCVCSLVHSTYAYSAYDLSDISEFSKACTLTDYEENIYLIGYTGKSVKIYKTSQSTIKSAQLELPEIFSGACAYGNTVNIASTYFAKDNNGSAVAQTVITSYNFASQSTQYCAVADVAVKNNNQLAFDGNYLYLLNYSNPNVISVYTTDGAQVYSLNLGKQILSVKYVAAENRVYVFTVTDAYLLYSFEKTAQCISSGSFSGLYYPIGGGYLLGETGRIYHFNGEKTEYITTVEKAKPDKSAYLQDFVFYYTDCQITGRSLNEKPDKAFALNGRVTAVLPLKDSIGVITEDLKLEFLKASDIPEIPTEPIATVPPKQSAPEDEGLQSSSTQSREENSKAAYRDISSSTYQTDKLKHRINVPMGTTIAQFKSNIYVSGYRLFFKNCSGEYKSGGVIGTGCSVTLKNESGGIYKTYTFIVDGDLTGEGNINSRDTKALLKHLNENNSLSGSFLEAADLNGDNRADILDLALLCRYL
ncbi:MAG: dockerin type I repeat-containing protein [Acutalibacteraceae bacterium]